MKSGNSRLGAVWFAVPGALLAGIILLPMALFAVSWRRDRRARRAYAAAQCST